MKIWKQYKNWKYEVSNTGNVRNLSKKEISTHKHTNGYLYVTLWHNGEKKTLSVHKLVATCFLPKLRNTEVINHIDRNKENNNVSNLEWVSQSENILHAKNNDNYKTDWKPPEKLQKLIDEAVSAELLTQDQMNHLYGIG